MTPDELAELLEEILTEHWKGPPRVACNHAHQEDERGPLVKTGAVWFPGGHNSGYSVKSRANGWVVAEVRDAQRRLTFEFQEARLALCQRDGISLWVWVWLQGLVTHRPLTG